VNKLEKIIHTALLKEATPGQGTSAGDPMAHLAAAAGKSVPAMSDFQKAAFKTQSSPGTANPAYSSTSPAMAPLPGNDFATMNKEAGVSAIGMGKPWSNQAAYNALMALGARPFLATKSQKGNVDWIPIGQDDIEIYIKGNEPDYSVFEGGFHIGLQLAMYNNPDLPVGTFVYFYENPNHMYFSYIAYGKWTYVNWEFEPPRRTKTDTGDPVTIGGNIWLMRGGVKEGYIRSRRPGSDEVIYISTKDPGLKNIQKSDWIGHLRGITGIDSLFKHNEPTTITLFGRTINLTALADSIQAGFDWIGIVVPPIDIVNAVWYMGRGRYFEAIISIIALIPAVGDGIAIVFKSVLKLIKASGRVTFEIAQTIFRRTRTVGIQDEIVIGSVNKCQQFVQLCRKFGFISNQTADAMLKEIDDVVEGLKSFLSKETAQKSLEKSKELQQKISKRLGLTIPAAAIEKKQWWQKFAGFLKSVGLQSISQLKYFIADVLTAGGRKVWQWLTVKSVNYWKSAYTMAFKQFKNVLAQDPNKFALCIMSFTDSAITTKYLGRIADLLIESTGAARSIARGGTYQGQEVFSFVINGRTARLTKEQLIAWIRTNPRTALEKLYSTSRNSYNRLLDQVIKEAATISDNINGFWTAFWTDPIRRFINENFKFGRLRSKNIPTDTGAGIPRNIASDVYDAFSGIWNNQDFLKRVDIIYNEIQEFLERKDYGTSASPSTNNWLNSYLPATDPNTGEPILGGKDLNTQSVIFALFDEAWYQINGTNLSEWLDLADEAIQELSASQQQSDKLYNDAILQGTMDSLSFQGFVMAKPGNVLYKTAWLKRLVEDGIAVYRGKPTSYKKYKLPGYPLWEVVKNAQPDLKKGTLIAIDPKNGYVFTNNWDGKLPQSYEDYLKERKREEQLNKMKNQ
jgi:hypothetical protein